jgi:asparagine synthase (glutamine-hydrolysing)
MSTIFGIIDKSGQNFDKDWLELMKTDLSHGSPDRTDTWSNEMAGMGNLLVFNTPESLTEILPYHHIESGLTICSDSRIDNRNILAEKLNISRPELKLLSDSALILHAYQKWGHDCPGYLRGDFSFAIYDEPQHQLYLARDHFGMKPLYYFEHSRYFIFSTELRGILALPFFNPELNLPWFLDFLINTTRKEFDTFYQGINLLPPGHHLSVKSGSARISKYWELIVPPKLKLTHDREYIEGYKFLFEQAVKSRTRSAFPVGAELSGGLDSSSITAIAQKDLATQGNQLHVFARVLPESVNSEISPFGNDESSEIQTVCDFCNIHHLHRVTMENQKINDNIAQVIDITKTPYRSNYATYNLNAHKTARLAGVRTILSGHGGDQMVTSQAVFVYRNYIVKRMYWQLFTDIRAKGTVHELDLLKSLKYLYKVYSLKTDFTKKRSENRKLFRFGIDRDFIEKYHLEDRFMHNRETEILAPGSLQDLIHKIIHRNMTDRVAITGVMAGNEQIEFRYPLFDVDLIQYYLAVPDSLKRKFRTGRYLHRMAMENELPQSIQWRTDKRTTINPGLDLIFINGAIDIKAIFNHLKKNDAHLFLRIFNQEMIQKLIADETSNIHSYKALINNFFQLQSFQKIVEKKLG